MQFAEPNDGFKPNFKPGPGMPAGMSPLPKELPPEWARPDAIPRGRGFRGDNFGKVKPLPAQVNRPFPQRLPSPNQAPRPVSGMPLPNFRGIARNVAWEILKPTPTADGTIPDFEQDLPDPEPEPDSKEKENICQVDCIPGAGYYLSKNNNAAILNMGLREHDLDISTSTYYDPGPRVITRDLGFYTRLSTLVPPDPTNVAFGMDLTVIPCGQRSEVRNGIKYLQFVYAYQYKGTLRVIGKKWQGKIGKRVSGWLRADQGWTFYSAHPDKIGGGSWEKRPSYYREVLWCRIQFCSDYSDLDPVPADDYEREEDNEMPCKWQPANDPKVASLTLVEIEYLKFVSCKKKENGDWDRFETAKMMVPELLKDSLKEMLIEQNKALATFCEMGGEAIAAVPEWWPNRIGSGRPQLIIQYAKKKNDGTFDSAKYVVTIPHYKDITKGNKAPSLSNIKPYEKGQYMGILTLPDNSKLIVNCKSSDEAKTVCSDLAKTTKYALGDCEFTISERKGQNLKEDRVYPRVMKFFPQGQKDTKPLWIYHIT